MACRRSAARRAYTLIDVLFSLLVVSILVSLAMLNLRGVRQEARGSVILAMLRQHAQVFTMYAQDHRGRLPIFGDAPAPVVHVEAGDGEHEWDIRYWFHSAGWHLGLASPYYDTALDPVLYSSPNSPHYGSDLALFNRDPWANTITDYEYSSAFLARAEYWNPATREGPDQWGGNRLDEVVFPSRKVLLRESWLAIPPELRLKYQAMYRDYGQGEGPPPPPLPRAPWRAATAAGGAAAFPAGARLGAYRGGEGDFGGEVHSSGEWGLHTIDGVRGRDLR